MVDEAFVLALLMREQLERGLMMGGKQKANEFLRRGILRRLSE